MEQRNLHGDSLNGHWRIIYGNWEWQKNVLGRLMILLLLDTRLLGENLQKNILQTSIKDLYKTQIAAFLTLFEPQISDDIFLLEKMLQKSTIFWQKSSKNAPNLFYNAKKFLTRKT